MKPTVGCEGPRRRRRVRNSAAGGQERPVPQAKTQWGETRKATVILL